MIKFRRGGPPPPGKRYGRILNSWIASLIVVMSLPPCVAASSAPLKKENLSRVEVKHGWFYVDGEKFFVKGVVYEGWRPGESPGADSMDLSLADQDFRMIREAGFNTIRTAGGLTPELITLAEKHGLMVMHGVWFEKNIDYRDSGQAELASGMVRENISWARRHDNVLAYLLANELPVERVASAGIESTEDFLRKIVRSARSVDGTRPLAMANWVPTALLDPLPWDAVAYNAYIYSPVSVMYAMGYEQYLEQLKKTVPPGKPFLLTEFGASVSPDSQGVKDAEFFGYGGNTPEEQSRAVLAMYDDILEAGATGGCVHEWIDAWWRPSDPAEHANDPEEWFGILGIDDKASDLKGTPRKAYYALKEYNQALVVEPRRRELYAQKAPVEVYAEKDITRVMVRVDDRAWIPLAREGRFWWKGSIDTSELSDGEHRLFMEAFAGDEKRCAKEQPLWVYRDAAGVADLVVEVATDSKEYTAGEKVSVVIRVKNARGEPVAGEDVRYSFFQAAGWQERKDAGVTDRNGEIKKEIAPFTPGTLVISAGITYQAGPLQKKAGGMAVVVIRKD
jgi:hypothetical protein